MTRVIATIKLLFILGFELNNHDVKVQNGVGPATSPRIIQIWGAITRRINAVAITTTALTSCQQERANMEFVTIRPSPGTISGDVD